MGIEKKRESVTHNSFLDRLTESFVLAAVEVLEKINSSRLNEIICLCKTQEPTYMLLLDRL